MNLAYDSLPAIYDVSFSDEKWVSTLDAVSAAAGAKGAMVFGLSEAEFVYRLDFASSYYTDKLQALPEFMERFGHYDQYGREFLMKAEPNMPISDLDIWPGEDLWNRGDMVFLREHINAFLRIGVNLSPSHGWKAGLILHLPEDLAVPSDESFAAAGFLSPHLGKSIEMNRFFYQLYERYRMVVAALDKVRLGISIATSSGEIVVSNSSAQRAIENSPSLLLDQHNRLRSPNRDIAEWIEYHIRQAAPDEGLPAASSATLHLPANGHREPLLLEVSSVREDEGLMSRGARGAIIYLIDPHDAPEIDVQMLTLLCGFTPGESDVAELVLQGLSADAIAQTRNVSRNTIKTQIKSIFAKAAVKTRGELVRKAAAISPPIY